MKVKRALISVTDKSGLIPFAKGLRSLGVEIISTGGTLNLLRRNKIKSKSIEEFTGFPEIFSGRLKTLNPKVHGGLLYVRSNTKQKNEARAHGIEPIDLVVVNLYHFEEAANAKGLSENEVIEQIDIGGPAMLRSAAKNFEFVGVVSSPEDYAGVLKELRNGKGSLSRKTRRRLASKVFQLTSRYDMAIAGYFASAEAKSGKGIPAGESRFPGQLNVNFRKVQDLRYGENPHQRAALYRSTTPGAPFRFRQLQGKELSFNNLLDIESALEAIAEFSRPAAAVIKHNNPCGVAEADDLGQALIDAITSDSMSAFGGIIAVTRELDRKVAEAVRESLPFFEVLIAPSFGNGSLKVFEPRKNLRLIEADPYSLSENGSYNFRFGNAGLLVQDADRPLRGKEKEFVKELKYVTAVKPVKEDLGSLIFVWKCAKHVKSNAIVLAKGTRTVGIGAGQMSRVDSVRIACRKAGLEARDAVLASDGFFPMADNIEVAHEYGVRMIIQPGGSVRDPDVIAACDRFGIGMVLTGKRHFRH
ncbi:MAG: bifunctional phosphoribosylaminoimidazolecarboxamide formyltransferase/IMP cyclohydrolase [Candidatus Omnitrophica bacterium]|nr:bifunctional phosphoribosylaminoimidazolecarboxamide formyltransferase/IMP cyclohydrolase [Candidatus Omnitrophota bacterium]